MPKRSRKLSTKRPRRSKSSSRKTMKRTKRQPSKKHTLKKHSSKKRKSRTKSVRKRKKTKKIVGGGVFRFEDFINGYNMEPDVYKMKEITDTQLQSKLETQPFVITWYRTGESIKHPDWKHKNFAIIQHSSEKYYLIFISKKSSLRIKTLLIMKEEVTTDARKKLEFLDTLDKTSNELDFNTVFNFIISKLPKPTKVDYTVPNTLYASSPSEGEVDTLNPQYASPSEGEVDTLNPQYTSPSEGEVVYGTVLDDSTGSTGSTVVKTNKPEYATAMPKSQRTSKTNT